MKRLAKMTVLALTVCALALALAACASPAAENNSNQAQTQTTTHVVTDAYGRQVELPADVKSVATVGSGARFVVYAGAQDKLVAVTQMETESSPARPYTVVYKDLFSALPATSNGNHLMETNVNTEQLLSLHPDVIVSSRSAAECDELQKATEIPVVGISYQDQLFTDDVYTSIAVVGQACGTSEHAADVVAKMKEWQADLSTRAAAVPADAKPSVYVGGVNYKGAKSFGGTYAQYAPLVAIDAVNVADSLGKKGSLDIDLEQLGAWNPDYMFLNMGNADLLKQDYASNQEFFDGLKAFQEGHLYSQPSYNYNGTNVEMGICDAYFIASVIYPEQFGDVDMATKYSEVFSTMLGADYYQTMKSNGMDFKQVKISL